MNITTKPDKLTAARTDITPGYMSGFGNSFETEALPGALPMGRNSPQRCALRSLCRAACPARHLLHHAAVMSAHGCIASGLRCGTPVASPKADAESVAHRAVRLRPICRSHSCAGIRRRSRKTDMTFLQGVQTITTAGDAGTQAGMAAHVYLVTASMVDQHFYNADGEMMFVACSKARCASSRNSESSTWRSPAEIVGHSARRQIPHRIDGRSGARLSVRELRRRVHAAGARADRRELSGQCARFSYANRGL